MTMEMVILEELKSLTERVDRLTEAILAIRPCALSVMAEKAGQDKLKAYSKDLSRQTKREGEH